MKKEKKYKLTKETIEVYGRKLYRIQALIDFDLGNPEYEGIKKGDLGGFIESEKNLSQGGYCWVFYDAMVFSDAKIAGNAKVFDNARVYDDAKVYGNAEVYDSALVFGNAEVFDNAKIYGDAKVCENSKVYGDAEVYNNALVHGDTEIHDCSEIFDNAKIYGSADIYGNAKIYDCAEIYDMSGVYDDAEVFGDAIIHGSAMISGDSKVCKLSDYIVFKNWWSSGRYFTWTRSNNMWRAGCFYGTGKELVKKAKRDSRVSGILYGGVVKYVKRMLKRIK